MWSNLQFTADLATFTEEILIGNLHSLFSDRWHKLLHKDVMLSKPNSKDR